MCPYFFSIVDIEERTGEGQTMLEGEFWAVVKPISIGAVGRTALEGNFPHCNETNSFLDTKAIAQHLFCACRQR